MYVDMNVLLLNWDHMGQIRLEWIFSRPILFKTGSAKRSDRVTAGIIQSGLEIFPRWMDTVPLLHCPYSEKGVCFIQPEPLILTFASVSCNSMTARV